jgi:hypothetical protein
LVGRVKRKPDFRTFKKIFNWTPLTARSKGRPKQRWEDNIIQDICQMNIKNWTAFVQNRVRWKNVVEKAETQAPDEEEELDTINNSMKFRFMVQCIIK